VNWPRLTARDELEGAWPLRFAQFIGFVVTDVALTGFVLGGDVAGHGPVPVVSMERRYRRALRR